MIIRPVNNGYICIQQNDHAKLSGWMAASWRNNPIPANEPSQNALVLAAAMHDIGWVDIDADPQWNENKGQPHSFQDEPLDRRVKHYASGIDQVAQEDPYAALVARGETVELRNFGTKMVDDWLRHGNFPQRGSVYPNPLSFCCLVDQGAGDESETFMKPIFVTSAQPGKDPKGRKAG